MTHLYDYDVAVNAQHLFPFFVIHNANRSPLFVIHNAKWVEGIDRRLNGSDENVVTGVIYVMIAKKSLQLSCMRCLHVKKSVFHILYFVGYDSFGHALVRSCVENQDVNNNS